MARPSPRLALLLALGVLPAALGFRSPAFGFGALALDALVLLLWTTDLALARAAAGASVRRELPERVLRACPFEIFLEVDNPGPRRLDVELWDRLPEGFSPREASFRLTVPPHGRARASWTSASSRRGEFALGLPAGERRTPIQLGLLRLRAEGARRLRVAPDLRGVLGFDALLRQRRLDEVGIRSARERGEGTEVASLRPYAYGDPYGAIDWKATARYGRPVTRERQAERRQNVVLLVDAGRRMAREAAGHSRLDRSIEAALLLGQAALRADDRVGLFAFADRPLAVVPPLRNAAQAGVLARALDGLAPVLREPPYGAIAAAVQERFPRRSLIVLFTDVAEPTSTATLVGPLAFLGRRHLVLCAVFQDPEIGAALRAPPGDTAALFRAGAAAELSLERARGLAALRRAGIRVVEAPAAELPVAAVNEYLRIKARRIL